MATNLPLVGLKQLSLILGQIRDGQRQKLIEKELAPKKKALERFMRVHKDIVKLESGFDSDSDSDYYWSPFLRVMFCESDYKITTVDPTTSEYLELVTQNNLY